jgi:uncharacterized membrane protein YgcG
MQKWLERSYADWVARKVLIWAQRTKKFPALPVGWEQAISWSWPAMPHVDEAREEAAVQNALKNATTDYSKLLGPDWQNRMTSYAKQLELARTLKLPLSVFETVSGGALEQNAEPLADEPAQKQKGK